ncbi:hypothetical protein BGZ49_002526 [Haplosporangium sp. Z 27]|nr:hypothetical protein BGZ49_002526 [Haplosporangium sp. Z 27]
MTGNLTYEGIKVETFFGEASSVVARNSSKYGGDTVRLGVFGKSSHDMIDNLVDLESKASIQCWRLGQGGYLALQTISYTSHRICPFWLKLREITRKTSASSVQAVDDGQVDHKRRKSFYPTITTPSARNALNSAK